ncbi:MAG TPA: glycine--tRNA ligase subunit beta [Thermodesulfovibrionales bacterium]|nr:glycine--tRNA ligase subunit beta [Thermodesulfovibrionales bacterium]
MSAEQGTRNVQEHLSLLLEIGTEEIPARFIPGALIQLREKASALFSEYAIDFSDISTYATPRRLALIISGIPPAQKDRIKEAYGPPQRAAFDSEGKPTKAAVGFAASQGVDVAALVVKTTDKGEYVVAVIEQKGGAIKEVLPEILEKIVLSLHFPKSMRWGDGTLRFVRPIHWILALCDGELISFEIGGIRSSNMTRGHRFLSPGNFVIKGIPGYIRLMETNYVIVDQETRKKIISDGITRMAVSEGGKPVTDEALLDTVTFLTEYPVPFLCRFSSEYLALPKELLITVMRDHQKFFAVEDEHGRLRDCFIVIGNTKEENAATIRAGAERVIRARFEDARFYYEEDRKRSLESRIEDLRRVTFHDRIGSLYDKTAKVVKLAAFISEKLFPEKKARIERAAWLSKTDLTSGVVGEFPELQGLMGKYYALNEGEDNAVAGALVEQYLPSFSGDRLPATDEGAAVSLADKVDSIVSFFAIGLTPTGSEDPFALRRQALGVIAILFERKYDLSLRELIELAVPAGAGFPGDVLAFFAQRIEPLFSSQGYENDVIQSVMHFVGDTRLPLWKIQEKIDGIRRFKTDADYNALLRALKRITNIITAAVEIKEPRRDLLLEEEEKALYDEIARARSAFGVLISERKYFDALKELSSLTLPVNNFFEKVLVNDKRDEIRLNRLALLREIGKMASSVADFSKLSERP